MTSLGKLLKRRTQRIKPGETEHCSSCLHTYMFFRTSSPDYQSIIALRPHCKIVFGRGYPTQLLPTTCHVNRLTSRVTTPISNRQDPYALTIVVPSSARIEGNWKICHAKAVRR